MKYLSTLLFVSVYCQIYCLGQADSSLISGFVKEIHCEIPIPEVKVYFYTDVDTLKILETDSTGNFSFSYTLASNRDYFLSFKIENSYKENHPIRISEREEKAMDYRIEIGMNSGNCEDTHKDLMACYKDYSEEQVDFDFIFLKEIMQEYPKMCLQTTPLFIDSEKQQIIEERVKHFKARLIAEEIDLTRIHFKSPKLKKRIDEDEQFVQCIFLEVISMDGNCD